MQDELHTRSSTRTTGNDPIESADPGGTRSTKPGNPDKSQPRQKDPKTKQSVVSGDRNTSPKAAVRGSRTFNHPRGRISAGRVSAAALDP
jgi:hypothetical protein